MWLYNATKLPHTDMAETPRHEMTRPRDSLYVNESRSNCSDPERVLRVVLSHSPTTEFGHKRTSQIAAKACGWRRSGSRRNCFRLSRISAFGTRLRLRRQESRSATSAYPGGSTPPIRGVRCFLKTCPPIETPIRALEFHFRGSTSTLLASMMLQSQTHLPAVGALRTH